MKLFGLFKKQKKEQPPQETEEISREEGLEVYSGTRVEVTTLDGELLFVAKLTGVHGTEAELQQFSEAAVSGDSEPIHVRIRGYVDHEKKAVHFEGVIAPARKNIWSVEELALQKAGNDRAFFRPLATGKDPEGNIVDFSNATAWTVSGKGITSKANEATLQTTITSKVKATVKASYITISRAKSGAYSAKKNTATITISPIQMANTLTLNKNAVVVNPKKGNNKVTLNVKALAPKGATDKIMWKVMSRDAVTGSAINGLLAPNADLENQHGAGIRRDAKNKKLTVTIPGTAPVGSVIKVGAYAEGGAVAYAYIYVTDKTTKVVTGLESVKPKNTISLKAGETAQLTPKLVTANGEKAVGESKWSQGNTIAYDTEPVSYILDKKSAQYVKVDANGKIVALQKGTAKLTIKTISGKSAKVTIKIAE